MNASSYQIPFLLLTPESKKKNTNLAGLLTYSYIQPPSHFFKQWQK